MSILPASKPKLTQLEAYAYLDKFPIGDYKVKLLGIRSYFKKTMGNPVTGDIGIYDDAIFIVCGNLFASYNANTDPSVARKGVATLVAPQMVLYKIGMHGVSGDHPYRALRQYSRVTVMRHGQPGMFTDTAVEPFYTDIHKGGYGITSSLGCQTIYPDQWLSFFHSVEDQLTRYKQTIIPYCLIEI